LDGPLQNICFCIDQKAKTCPLCPEGSFEKKNPWENKNKYLSKIKREYR
jgi:hypothetical protein